MSLSDYSKRLPLVAIAALAWLAAPCAAQTGGSADDVFTQELPLVLTASHFNCYISPMINRQVCGGDFETVIKRSEYGITWGLAFGFEDNVRLLVQVEAIRQ